MIPGIAVVARDSTLHQLKTLPTAKLSWERPADGALT
jgi:hypothetical protein